MKVKIPGAESANFIAANAMTPFPGTSILRPQQIAEAALDGSPLDVNSTPDWVIQTWTYGIDFLDIPWPDEIQRPDYLSGTTLKLKVKASGQFLTLPAKAFQTSSTSTTHPDGSTGGAEPTSPPPGANCRIIIPTVDYEVEWDRIPLSGGHYSFGPCIGAVNQSTFMSTEAETLLCEAVDYDPSWLLATDTPYAGKAVVHLKQRRIVVGSNVYGWNYDYLPKTGWTRITMKDAAGNTVPRYPLQDFSDLFQ